ncbi:hypothetical protein GCM10010168_61720 [Actinoplanes ianthinogenes]|uniref:Uncharacterized protein n=2 Tax=Actinoplanes ianthinogenes TaxID=122358 RepID=A0ABM7M4N4_9ACTN|nr:hypothetical protein Aiant_71900 [Actinoplanes ianthinogenes]GGR34888.1 hypothetical protein GCM10010168_61720 [Actinoplanes ianthinogenes]
MWQVRAVIGETAPALVAPAVVKDGVLLGRHEPWAVMALPNHTSSESHYDIAFSTRLDRRDEGLIVDCVSGIGEPREALGFALGIWRQTSGACFMEMASGGRGEFATRLDADDPAGLAGWHTISSPVLAYGRDEASGSAVQEAMLEHHLLGALSPYLAGALDRPVNNGIKVFLCLTPDSLTAEVRVNGEVAEEATAAMAALPWPEVTDVVFCRFFAVAVHPV